MPTSTDATRLRSEKPLDPCERAQLLPDPLDLRRTRLAVLAQLRELRAPGFVVGEELLRERPATHLFEDLAQPLLRAVVDDAWPARKIAVLGDVRHGVAHVLVAALVEQVDDELQLVEAFVVGDLGLVTGLDQDVEARLHERGDAAAEHRLLAEEVALRLLREGRLEEPDARASDPGAVGERELERV